MNIPLAIVTCGLLAGFGLVVIISSLLTPQPRLAPAMERLAPRRLGVVNLTGTDPVGHHDGIVGRIGQWLSPHLSTRTGFTPPDRDLNLLGMSREQFYGEKAVLALGGLALPSVSGLLSQWLGFGLGYVLPLGAGLVMALIGWFIPDTQVSSKAGAARQDFTLAAVAYLQLVAILRRAGRGTASSMHEAAALSDSWTFKRIRTALYRAQLAQIPAWDALDELSEDMGVPALEDVANIMRSAGEDGAGVYESLVSRANSLRSKSLSSDHGSAMTATSAMSIPVATMVTLFAAALVLPALAQI